jgi:Tfp pilus assembly protein PilO
MQWEVIATWVGLLITVGGFVFKMGQQQQQLKNQQDQIDDLKEQAKDSQEIPIKLATLETDIKYLVQEFAIVKQFLMNRSK